jgi:glutamate-1-semialdehyde 2,1-aminomutase
MKKTIAIIQARVGSSRFKGKVLQKVGEYSLVSFLINRLKRSKKINKIIFAVSEKPENRLLIKEIKKQNIDLVVGSEKNVFSRYIKTLKKYESDNFVRLTCDCPASDPNLIDKFIDIFNKGNFDYLSNTIIPTFPDGFDIEIIRTKTFLKLEKKIKTSFDREHVTSFIKNSSFFKKKNIFNKKDYSNLRLTIDYKKDLVVFKKIYNLLGQNINFKIADVINLFKKNKDIFKLNINFKRSSSDNSSSVGSELWEYAKKIIPGGNMFLSKRPEMFLPNRWPSYYIKSKNCYVWGLDKKRYLDMSFMGVGTNILGYANSAVDKAVKKVVNSGNLTTLNAPDEVYFMDKLLSLHPWASMGKLTRSGGEANAVAIRIARISSKHKNIAICGYHGWHDWYLSANLSNKKSLDNQLLPGLSTLGVSNKLKDTVFTFGYNKFDELLKLVSKKKIGIIKMEVSRNFLPKKNFLKKIRKLCDKKKIILIFDECTSGFRETYGGLHLKYKVNPDIAIFGKAIGNGYPINAIIGKKEIMENSQKSFISSTFWSDRIGPAAGLATLKEMERTRSWEDITQKGLKFRRDLMKISSSNNVKIDILGLPSLTTFKFRKNHEIYKTFLTQEMLKKNILATNSLYLSICHDNKKLKVYLNEINTIFEKIKNYEKKGIDPMGLLEVPIASTTFKRLN